MSKPKFNILIMQINNRAHKEAIEKQTYKELLEDGSLIPIGKFLRKVVTNPTGVRTLPKTK